MLFIVSEDRLRQATFCVFMIPTPFQERKAESMIIGREVGIGTRIESGGSSNNI